LNVVERLRALCGRPLDPAASRAVLVLASAAGTGFAIVAMLGGLGAQPTGGSPASSGKRPRAVALDTPVASSPSSGQVVDQDAQDRPGTSAHRRAAREVAAHRALQHVPYRDGAVSIALVGVLRGRAVLQVKAPTVGAARRGWREFLRRYDDPGRAYVPRLEAGARR
jgi:hypothetical protein